MKKLDASSRMVLAALLALSMAFCAMAVGSQTWSSYKSDVVGQQKSQMISLAQALASDISRTISYRVEDLESLSAIFQQYDSRNLPPFATDFLDILLEDPYVHGVVLRSEQGDLFWGCNAFSVATIDATTQYSPEIALHVFHDGQDQAGYLLMQSLPDGRTLSLLLDLSAYYADFTAKITDEDWGYISVETTQNIVLMHPATSQVGLSVLQGTQALYGDVDVSGIEDLLNYQRNHLWGVYEYKSYWWNNESPQLVRQIAAHAQAHIGDDILIVSSIIDYDQIYLPIENSLQTMIATGSVIFCIVMLFFGYILSLVTQRERIQEEITYLQQLNHVLEETRRTEQALAHQQRLQIMGTMTGGIAHEFNNMLTPIMAYADLLQYRFAPESEEYEFTGEILDAAEHAKEVIGNISQLSRRNMDTVFRFHPAIKLLRRSVKMAQPLCPDNITFTQTYDVDPSQGILCNETQINQVILNLCVNAFHAIGEKPNGQLTLHCSVNTMANQGDATQPYLTISLTDNGCGMERSIIDQIFNPFFTTKLGSQGTGLGLSIVEQIIHSHKGRIQVDSAPNQGTRFTISLPMVDQSAVTHAHANQDAQALSIVIVDENNKILRMLEKTLQQDGITLHTCTTMAQASALLSSAPFHALLVDANLTQGDTPLDAIDYCISLAGTYPRLIKLVMANQVRKELVDAHQHGFIQGYLEKPVSDVMILDAIHQAQQGQSQAIERLS